MKRWVMYMSVLGVGALNGSCNEIFGHEFADPMPPGYCDTKIAPTCPEGQRCDLAQNRCVAEDTTMGDDSGIVSNADTTLPDDLTCSLDIQCKNRFPGTKEFCLRGSCAETECITDQECSIKKDTLKKVCGTGGMCFPGCQRNYECPNSACDDNGRCHDSSKIVYVQNTRTCGRGSGNGSIDQPLCSIADAIQIIEAYPEKDLIFMKTTAPYYQPSLPDVVLSKSVRIVGQRPFSSGASSPSVNIYESLRIAASQNIEVRLEDLVFIDLKTTAIECTSLGSDEIKANLKTRYLWVEGATRGIKANTCNVEVISSFFGQNKIGGMMFYASGATLYNNILIGNGTSGMYDTEGGIAIISSPKPPAAIKIAFNTLVENLAFQARQYNSSIQCPYNTPVEYTIIIDHYAAKHELNRSIGGCILNNSLVPSYYTLGTGNNSSDGVLFKNRYSDLHLSSQDTKARGKVPVKDVPILFDFDGNWRNSREDHTTDIGADHYVP